MHKSKTWVSIEYLHGAVEFFQRDHSGRHVDREASFAYLSQQAGVCDTVAGDLQGVHANINQEIQRWFVKWGDHKFKPQIMRVCLDIKIGRFGKL